MKILGNMILGITITIVISWLCYWGWQWIIEFEKETADFPSWKWLQQLVAIFIYIPLALVGLFYEWFHLPKEFSDILIVATCGGVFYFITRITDRRNQSVHGSKSMSHKNDDGGYSSTSYSSSSYFSESNSYDSDYTPSYESEYSSYNGDNTNYEEKSENGMRQCPDCHSIDLSSVFAQTRGDGKCSECRGTGLGDSFDQFNANLVNEKSICEVCYGTKQCQTCGGEGIIYN